MKKFLLTVVFAVLGAWVFAQERIAVFPFEDRENILTRNEKFMLYDEFSNEFTNRNAGRFSVVERQDVDRLINTEMDFQLTVFSAQEKTAEMMRVQNATRILSGTIGTLNDENNRRTEIRFTVSLYTYPDLLRLPGGATLSVTNKNELFNKIPELVQQMQNAITEGTAQPIPEGLLYEVVDVDIPINTRINGFLQESMRLTNWARQSYEYGDYSASAGFAEEALRFADLSDEYVSSQLAESLYASIDGVLFDKNIRTLIKYPQGKAQRTYYVIPSSITSIVGYAFYYCSILTGVSIPSSVLSIGGSTFAGCSNLTSITVDNRNPTYASIDGVLFDKNIQTLIRYPQGRTQRTYVIPSSVTEIGYTALAGCSSLTNIIIPSSVTYISYNAFADTTLLSISVASCSSLTSISVDNRNPAYASIDGVLFDKNIQTIIQYPVGRNQKTYVIPSSVTTIGDGAFSDCSSLTNVTIPSSVTSVGYYAFAYCSNLTSVIIPYSVTSIRDYVFWGCSSLTSVTIPSSVSSIGGWAFYGCSSLTSVTIPSSVTSIGNNAFADCSSLTSVTLSRRTQVGERAFPPNTRITYRD